LRAVPGIKRRGGRFFYPKRGFGQISDAYYKAAVAAGARVEFDATVSSVEVDGGRVAAVTADGATGRVRRPARHVLSTIPLTYLARAMRPMPPGDVLAAADALQYRAMILVYLVLDAEQFSEYDAHYFPDANLTITRLSEPKNYSLAAAAGTTVLCAELPCAPDDATWSLTNEQLADLVRNDLAAVGLPIEAPIRRVVSRRLRQAYPIYTADYRRHFDRIDAWVGTIEGVTTLGRQGLFAHDNTHHTLAMAYAAGDCLAADGRFDQSRWQEHRRHFESHVVED
jgi:protoporphyrinogen oxidase